MRKPFYVSYGFTGRKNPEGPLESFIPAGFTAKDYNGEALTLEDAEAIFREWAPEINADADYDEFLPICIEVQVIPNTGNHACYLPNIDYVICDGKEWYIPLKEGVKKVSREKAIGWISRYIKAVDSYEKRVSTAPETSLKEWMFGDKTAYPTEDELEAMPK